MKQGTGVEKKMIKSKIKYLIQKQIKCQNDAMRLLPDLVCADFSVSTVLKNATVIKPTTGFKIHHDVIFHHGDIISISGLGYSHWHD